jgi:hypothetical protein
MGNTLTPLIPVIYRVLPFLHRELTGLIPAVTLDAQAARAAVGQTVRIPTAPTMTSENATPGTNPPDTGDNVFDQEDMTITKSKVVPFRWTGDEERSIAAPGPGRMSLQEMQVFEALRVLVNEVETDLAALYKRSARALGTAGTTPFASNIDLLVDAKKVMDDMGIPQGGRQFVMDTSASAKLRKLSHLQKVNEAGTSDLLRLGLLDSLMGFDLRESAQIALHTAGTGANYILNQPTGVAAGATTIAMDGGTGTIVAGDVITIANGSPADDVRYVVNTALSGGSLVIGRPGLKVAHADADAVTLAAAYRANMVFHRSALALATRAPAIPSEGDEATDAMIVTDPVTGLSFEVRVYKQYRRVRYEIGLAWGVANLHPAFTINLLG